MKSARLLAILLFILSVFSDSAFAQVPEITGVQMYRCGNKKNVLHQGETQKVLVWGTPGFATALTVSVSGSGVTAQITRRVPYSPAAANPSPFLVVVFNVSGSAATTRRTVTINGPLWQDTFRIYVRKKARITSVEVPSPQIWFQNNVDVLLRGEKLSKIREVRAVVLSPVFDVNNNQISPASVTATAVINNSASQSSFQTPIRLNFSRRLTQASVRLQLFGDKRKCGAMRAHWSNPLTKTVTIKARPSNANFVKSITFPFGSTFGVGDLVTIQLNLNRVSSVREEVWWKLIPGDAVEQVAGGTAYNRSNLNKMTIPVGQQSVQVKLGAKQCIGNSTNTSVKIQTWIENPNVNKPPWFKEKLFHISCPKN